MGDQDRDPLGGGQWVLAEDVVDGWGVHERRQRDQFPQQRGVKQGC
jgi:hypothetical protein